MVTTIYVYRDSRRVITPGGSVPLIDLQLGSSFDVSIAFLNEAGDPIALASGSTGRLVLKPRAQFTSGARFKLDTWSSVTGTGASTRYHFKGKLDSRKLRTDLGNLATKDYDLQIEFTELGNVASSQPVATVVSNGYFQAADAAPELPLGGPEAIDFHSEILPPGIAHANGTHFGGYINRGGDLFNVRLSCNEYHAGSTVQILVNGATELFTEPVTLNAATKVWTPDDLVNKLALTSLADGDRLDVIIAFAGGSEYPVAADGLVLDIALRTTSTIEQEGWEWLKQRCPEANGFTHDDDLKELTVEGGGGSSTPAGAGFSIVDGALRFTIDGTAYEIPAFVVP